LKVDKVAVMSCFEVVILQKFFILKVTILSLDGVELIAQGKVVFVSLLNLEDLCFKLADEQVFLVRSEMDTVIILKSGHFCRKILTRDIFVAVINFK